MMAAKWNRRTRGLSTGLVVAVATAITFAFGLGSSTREQSDVIAPPAPAPAPDQAIEQRAEITETATAALERVNKQITAARAKVTERRGELADLLMRSAELYRELGSDRDARAAYAEVRDSRSVAASDHWQAREAVRRLADLDAEISRPEPERVRLRHARELHRSAAALCHRGRYLPAVAVCEQALAVRRELLPAPHHDLSESLLLLGQIQSNRGEFYSKAFDTLSAAREEARKTVGADHPLSGTCLHWLAMLEDDRGAFVEAQDLYNAALRVFLTARGEFSAEYARTLARLARMHADWWVTGAEAKVIRAMQIRESLLGSNHPDLAESLQDLGVILFHNIKLKEAKDLFLRAKAIREATLGAGHPTTAETLSWLGGVLLTEVDLTFAHAYHRRAIAVAEEAHGPDHPAVARALDQCCRLSLDEEDFDRTEHDYDRSVAIREHHGLQGHPHFAASLAGRARNLDNWVTSIVFVDGAAVDIRPAHKAYERAVSQFERLPNAARLPAFADTLALQASLYYIDEYRFQDQGFVRGLLARARGMMEQSGSMESHPAYLSWLTAEHQLVMFDRDYAAAVSLCRRMQEYTHSRYGSLVPYQFMFTAFQRLGLEVHRGPSAGGVTPELTAESHASLRNLTLLTHRLGLGQSCAARLAILRGQIEMLSVILSLVIDHKLQLDPYEVVLTHRGQLTAAQVVDQLVHDKPELASLVSRLGDTRRNLTRTLYTPPPAATGHAAWIAEVRRLGALKDDLESEVAFRARDSKKTERREPTVTEVQAALPPGTVLIEYCCFRKMKPPFGARGRMPRESQMVAFVVSKDRPPAMVPLGSRAVIEDAVTAWRRAVAATQSGRLDAGLTARAAAVADLIWKPLVAYVGSADTLFVAPDGPVCFVPFAVLPGKASGNYLLEDYRIGYVPAGRTIADAIATPTAAGNGLLKVGGLDYSPRSVETRPAHKMAGSFPNLPCAKVEIDDVERQYLAAGQTGVAHLGDRLATVDAFTHATAAHPRYIHFAGHGFFAEPGSFPDPADSSIGRELFLTGRIAHPAVLRNQQLFSGLVLSPGEHPADQLLTAEQVSGLDLRETELVVLSACETGVGNLAFGEGGMSLQRAFLTAGSRAVVGSLWKVDDAVTSVLMDEFYRNLWDKKQSKLDALRNAQLALLRRPQLFASRATDVRNRSLDTTTPVPLPAVSADGKTDPTLWAAFILTGDGR